MNSNDSSGLDITNKFDDSDITNITFYDSDFINLTYYDHDYYYEAQVPVMYHIYRDIEIFIIIVGTLLNLWFLSAILSSQDTRSRLRNKIICNSLVLHLVDSVIVLPFYVWLISHEHVTSCIVHSLVNHFGIIQDFIGNWLLVMLLVLFIAQIQDFSPRMKLSPTAFTLGTVSLLAFPWIASLILVPVLIHNYHEGHLYFGHCYIASWAAVEVFRSADTAAPIFLAVLLLIVAVFLRCRRFTRGNMSRSMQNELIRRGPDIDNIIAYIIATAICIFCDLFQLIYTFKLRTFLKYGYETAMNMHFVSIMMSDSRVILVPLPWLLLPDIRQRIRTWRPWHRSAPATDLTVLYRKDETE